MGWGGEEETAGDGKTRDKAGEGGGVVRRVQGVGGNVLKLVAGGGGGEVHLHRAELVKVQNLIMFYSKSIISKLLG